MFLLIQKNYMKAINSLFFLLLITINCISQSIYNKIYQNILYVDTLKYYNNIDLQIKNLRNDIRENDFLCELDVKYYNLAICYAAKNNIDSVLYFLKSSLLYSDRLHDLILTDDDFDFIRNSIFWNEIVSKIDSIFLEKNKNIKNKNLAIELYHIYLKDQYARGLGLKKRNQKLDYIDKENLQKIEEIVNKYGWPTYSMVGERSARAAAMIIIHSDNVEVQKKYLKMINEAAINNEASKESLALLIDKISVKLTGYQIFGTQVYQEKDLVTGKFSNYRYFPIRDEIIVDSLRKEFGLIPLKQYFSIFGIDYKNENVKK